VHVSGSGAREMMFAHGFGCDQTMWRMDSVAQFFSSHARAVIYAQVISAPDGLGLGMSTDS